MPLSDDPWIAEHSHIDPERLHALGMITLWWNHCERNLLLIFSIVFQITPRVGWIIAGDMGDISVARKMAEMLKLRPPPPDVGTLLTAFLKAYDVGRQNRNALTHFTTQTPKADPTNFAKAVFVRMKGESAKANPLPSSLEDVRRIALETHYLSIYSWQIYKALAARSAGRPVPLPPPIVPPVVLHSGPPVRQSRPKSKRPPRPSAASRRKKRRPVGP
jgi:hypothetical protein